MTETIKVRYLSDKVGKLEYRTCGPLRMWS